MIWFWDWQSTASRFAENVLRLQGVCKVPKIKCDWDCCKHINFETGYCECPDDVVMENQDIEIDNEKGGTETEQYLVCKSYEDFHEGGVEQVEGKSV
jgi:hypothetical protein